MPTLRFGKWFLMIIIVTLLVSACSSQNATEPDPTDQVAENGNGSANESEALIPADVEPIYTARCIHCHGPDLKGRMGDNSNLVQVGARLSQDEIAETIRNGKNLMPAFENQLSDEEIAMLAEWLAAKK